MLKIDPQGIHVSDLQAAPRVSEACEALVEVTKVIEKDEFVLLILTVIGATKKSQLRREHSEYLHLPTDESEKAVMLRQRILRFLLAFGLISEAEIEADEPVDFDPQKFVDREAIVEFSAKKNQSLQISFFGAWSIDDPTAPTIPSTTEKVEVTNV